MKIVGNRPSSNKGLKIPVSAVQFRLLALIIIIQENNRPPRGWGIGVDFYALSVFIFPAVPQ
jgi:hypothetical protein